MKKEEIRKEILQYRKQLKEKEVDRLSNQIFEHARRLPIWQHQVYHSFLPIKRNKEVNTWPFIHFLRDELGKEVALPKADFKDMTLEHIRYDVDTELYKTKFGIPEPIRGIHVNEESIDVVFVPLLAFDKKGNRVGYGKGFYDRFLAKCRENTISIGLTLDTRPVEIDDVDEFDFPLDFCITPEGVFEF